ncbi:MAG TPA: hypothetical protein V6D20_16835 [Candidatus Obscuribacterales bacterium]
MKRSVDYQNLTQAWDWSGRGPNAQFWFNNSQLPVTLNPANTAVLSQASFISLFV